ncbi:hypothetical protein A2291_01755 [candidate division WOR-1 bacterium RIFOXYB2_FULL_42_35]|uniref:V-type ATP synthase subunit E n=1 Tax=candidate division WOR-1 bacterium RIFOXYC2_FULL_41_25 TaxID=1802586 RepID=A0A1F4TQD2_UNCSA|nr:MAG: hypothetical protein A2247_03555 [candidate division WOR-1 bacterium RIFOXYA2_FULL_41_14]OGC25470.1 MAG: hypothetical protein A2291_01755 [candidate division WOR-1 bacterium RIFOXYB2_FULL_42_35]OGC34876.1 MAG: hypothetical protein A2462_05690 [candidate division WOR-1 bacterium RIFOXYC2_FULL_41_25]
MSINEIEQKILEQAKAEAKKIEQENSAAIKVLEAAQTQKTAVLKQQAKLAAEQKIAAVKMAVLVPARLKAKKNILEEKQAIITRIYAEMGTEKNLTKPEINRLREETEIAVAQVLFG